MTLTVGNNNSSTNFSGSLIGGGGLIKIGGGTLTLSGANSFGGGTTVQSGLLQLNQGDGLPQGTPGSNGVPPGGLLEIDGSEVAPAGVVLNNFLMSASHMGYGSSSGGPVPAPTGMSPVFEPGTLLLLAAGAVLMALAAWRQKRTVN